MLYNLMAKSVYKIKKRSKGLREVVSKGAKIRNRYNQVPHLTQDTNGKVTNSQLYTTNESQEVSPFPMGDHKTQINRRAQKTEKTIKDKVKYFNCTHNPEDWKNKSIKRKCGETF